MHTIAAAIATVVLLSACAFIPPADDPPIDPEAETGAAVGLLVSPASRSVLTWAGQVLLQMITNTRIDIKLDDIKLDHDTNPKD